jgi:hypothetical protein
MSENERRKRLVFIYWRSENLLSGGFLVAAQRNLQLIKITVDQFYSKCSSTVAMILIQMPTKHSNSHTGQEHEEQTDLSTPFHR